MGPIYRGELLNIVRKHSLALGNASSEDAEVDSRFWCELLDLFFVRGLADRKHPQDDDDLVFFVNLQVGSKILKALFQTVTQLFQQRLP